MNSRERFLATMRFGQTDRVSLPSVFQTCEAETVRRWQREGLPRDTQVVRYFGFDRAELAPINLGPMPTIERAELDDAEEWNLGAERDEASELESGFVAIEEAYPVRQPSDWPHVRRLLNPDAPARLPRFWDDFVRVRSERDYPLGISVPGPFTSLCDWLGAAGLASAAVEERAWVEEMADYLAQFVGHVLDRASGITPDFLLVGEDRAYLADGVLGVGAYRRLFEGFFRALDDRASGGVVVCARGNVLSLIPHWVDLGVRLIGPLEVAAGIDGRILRRELGHGVALFGNVDCNALSSGKRAISAEVRGRVRALLADGGYFPAPDGPVHSEVELASYEHFLGLLRG